MTVSVVRGTNTFPVLSPFHIQVIQVFHFDSGIPMTMNLSKAEAPERDFNPININHCAVICMFCSVPYPWDNHTIGIVIFAIPINHDGSHVVGIVPRASGLKFSDVYGNTISVHVGSNGGRIEFIFLNERVMVPPIRHCKSLSHDVSFLPVWAAEKNLR